MNVGALAALAGAAARGAGPALRLRLGLRRGGPPRRALAAKGGAAGPGAGGGR